MKKMPISKFKATCLSLIDEVSREKKSIVITKHGKPVAEVIPYQGSQTDETLEIPLKDTVVFMGDILSPVAEEDWEVLG